MSVMEIIRLQALEGPVGAQASRVLLILGYILGAVLLAAGAIFVVWFVAWKMVLVKIPFIQEVVRGGKRKRSEADLAEVLRYKQMQAGRSRPVGARSRPRADGSSGGAQQAQSGRREGW